MALRIGVVGYGMRGAGLAAEAERAGGGARVAAVCEADPARRAACRERFPDALATQSLEDMLSQGLDAVIVATPDDMHAGPVVAALEAGAAVFCEKPMAVTLEECDAMLAAARATGGRLYMGHNMRHMPVVALMRRLIEQGAIGQVMAVWCRHFVGNGGDYYFKDWHADRSRSVGLLLQKGAHDIDVVHHLAGAFTAQVQGVGALSLYGRIADRRDRSGELMRDWYSVDNWPPLAQTGLNPVVDVEDISQVNMVLDDGRLASYEQCHYTPDYWRNYTVIGTAGRLENFGDEEGSVVGVWDRRHRGHAPPDKTYPTPSAHGGHGGADGAMMAEFLGYVRGGPATTSAVAARQAVATGLCATRSIRGGGGLVAVPQVEQEVAAYFAAVERGEA